MHGSPPMMPPVVEPVCPQCSSPKLTFLEHGSGGAVFRCEECGRATIQRWMAAPKADARVPVRPRSLMAFGHPRTTDG